MTKPNEILSREIFSVGSSGITLQSIASAAIIIALSFLAVWVIRNLIGRAQRRLGEDRASALYVGGQVARYVIVVAATAAAISALGVDLSALSLFAGALGVGIGLGLQDVVKNFVCGLILLFDGSIEIGDFIELEEGAAGAVAAIGPRATTLRTNDNVDVLVPNANLLSGKLKNWTRDRVTRRVHIPFPVAYGSDKELVRQAALEAAAAVPFTLADTPNHKTQVWLTGFGDSALNFELVVWPNLEAVKRPGSMMAAYHWALDDALRSHGIEMPYPQSEVRLRSYYGLEGRNAIEAIAGKGDQPLPENPKAPKLASVNDAAQDVSPGETGD